MSNKIRDSCKFRPIEAKSLFMGELTYLPECLVNMKDGTPYHNAKCTIVPLLTDGCVKPVTDIEGLVVDLSVIKRAKSTI